MKEQLKTLRLAAGLSQAQLARKRGYDSTSVICMWESGRRKPPTDKLPQLARVFGCSIDELFEKDQ